MPFMYSFHAQVVEILLLTQVLVLQFHFALVHQLLLLACFPYLKGEESKLRRFSHEYYPQTFSKFLEEPG